MTIITPSQPAGYASLPAEFRTRSPRGTPDFTRERFMRWGEGVAGLPVQMSYDPAWMDYHLGVHGIGDYTPIPGSGSNGMPMCRDNDTGNVVYCPPQMMPYSLVVRPINPWNPWDRGVYDTASGLPAYQAPSGYQIIPGTNWCRDNATGNVVNCPPGMSGLADYGRAPGGWRAYYRPTPPAWFGFRTGVGPGVGWLGDDAADPYAGLTPDEIQQEIVTDPAYLQTLNTLQSQDISALQAQLDAATQAPPGYAGPRQLPAGATTPTPPAGYQWANVINAAGNTLLKTLVATTPGASMQQLPNGLSIVSGAGGQVGSYGSFNSVLGGGTFSSSTLALLGIGAIALVLVMSKR